MTIARATILIAVFSIASKLLGVVRQAVFTNNFGLGEELDIYVAAFRIPDLLFNLLIMGTLSVAFIPVFVEYLSRNKKKEALEIASSVFNLTVLIMAFFAIVIFLASPVLVQLIAPGFSLEAKAKTLQMTRILLLSPLFFSLSSVLGSILQSHNKFLLAAVAPLFYNLSIIFGAIFLYPRLGITGLAWGVVLGAFLHLMIQFPSSIKLGLRPFRNLNLQHPGIRKIGKLFLPRVFGVDLGQISLLIASVFISFATAGSLSAFYFAYDLETVPIGVFAVSFAITVFPSLSEFASKNDMVGFKKVFAETCVQILYFIIPISVLMLIMRAQIARLIWGFGQGTRFDFQDTRLAASVLGFFVISLFAQSLIPILARSFFALQNTFLPMIVGLVSSGINILLVVALRGKVSAPNLALAFSIAVIFNMLTLFVLLRRKLGDLHDDFLFLRSIKISIASIIMAVIAFATMHAVAPFVDMQTYLGILIQTIIATSISIIGYLGIGLLIGLPESASTVRLIKVWFFKFTRPFTSTVVNMFTDLK